MGGRTNELVVLELFKDVRQPSEHARGGEHGREQLLRDSQRAVRNPLVELEIGAQRTLRAAVLLHEGALDRRECLEQPAVTVVARGLLRKRADNLRAWIDDTIFAMAHAHYTPLGFKTAIDERARKR